MSAFIDLTGQKFGRLTPIKCVDKNKYGHSLWLCKCCCGNETTAAVNSLRSGLIQSCGCLHIKHGHTIAGKKSKTYRIWDAMIQRCTNINATGYKNYGGRNPPITVCKRWLPKNNGFINFLKDVGEIPQGLTLDRKNNNKGYSSNNFRLVSWKEQSRNKRNNIMVPYNGKDVCLKDYCKIKGLKYRTIVTRIHRGLSVEDAISKPIRKRRR